MTPRQAVLQSFGPSHYVVQFDCDECISTISRKQLVRPLQPHLGERCWVNWNGEDYSAKVIAMGDLATVKKAEADILLHLDEDAEVSQEGAANNRSPPKKKRRFGFGKSKDTKKKAKKTSQKKEKQERKAFCDGTGFTSRFAYICSCW